MVLFSICVLTPFVESLLLNALMAKRGLAIAATGLHVAMLILAIASFALYADTVLILPNFAAGFQVCSSSRCLVRLDHRSCRHSGVCIKIDSWTRNS